MLVFWTLRQIHPKRLALSVLGRLEETCVARVDLELLRQFHYFPLVFSRHVRFLTVFITLLLSLLLLLLLLFGNGGTLAIRQARCHRTEHAPLVPVVRQPDGTPLPALHRHYAVVVVLADGRLRDRLSRASIHAATHRLQVRLRAAVRCRSVH